MSTSKHTESIALQEITAVDMGNSKPLQARNMDLVGHVSVELSAEIGHVEITLQQLFNTKAGDVLRMQEAVDTPITLYLNQKPVARGTLVVVDDNFGVQISEIL